jgi:alkylation response protein AidB-like acyl-CoA dehydrogenase
MHAQQLPRLDLARLAADLGPGFAQRAGEHDAQDTFVAENYEELRKAKAFSAGVPEEFGGGGASIGELCEFLRLLSHSCGSTALAFSMHTHLVAMNAWRWRHQKAPVDGLLKRIAKEELVLVSNGGADWLAASGVAEKVEGGFRITARKIFSSGCPGGQVLMTSAVYQDPLQGPQVLHFPVDLKAAGVKVLDTWHTMGMRGTGSHDIMLEGVVVPEAAVGLRRPQGKWHMLFHVITKVALPIIYSVYFGLAEEARNIAVREAGKKRDKPETQVLVGEMENELTAARLARNHLVDLAEHAEPGPETTNAVLIGRTLAARHSLAAVSKALDVVGGSSFYRSVGLERIFRDIQGARFHPIHELPQQKLTGRLALGLPIDE